MTNWFIEMERVDQVRPTYARPTYGMSIQNENIYALGVLHNVMSLSKGPPAK